MKSILFFATPLDIRPALVRFEGNAPLKFVEMSNLATPNRAVYLEASQIPNAGVATHEAGSISDSFMVFPRETEIVLNSFALTTGERRWSLYNVGNEDSVVLTLAGLWKTGTLLPGTIATMHNTPAAQKLMRWFLTALKQEGFVKVDHWWLGSEAMVMLKAGKRLAPNGEQAPPEVDLRLPEG